MCNFFIFIKVLLILSVAGFLANRTRSVRTLPTLLFSLLYVATAAALVFLQPNLSTAMVYLFIRLAMVVAAGARGKHLGVMAAIGLATLPAVWLAMAQYQRDRVLSIFNPTLDYNRTQALISVGSGGWFGQGYAGGSQNQLHFLKVRHTDFIFSVIGEEFGFVGALVVVIVLGFIVYRCLRAARMARDPFGSLIAYGVAILIFFQGAVNIAVNLKLIPVTGLPLPFISYGGSGLLSMMLGVGLVESVILRHKQLDF